MFMQEILKSLTGDHKPAQNLPTRMTLQIMRRIKSPSESVLLKREGEEDAEGEKTDWGRTCFYNFTLVFLQFMSTKDGPALLYNIPHEKAFGCNVCNVCEPFTVEI